MFPMFAYPFTPYMRVMDTSKLRSDSAIGSPNNISPSVTLKLRDNLFVLPHCHCGRISTSSQRSLVLLLCHLRPVDKVLVLNRDTLRHMVDLVHADKARCKLKHVVS